MTEELSRTETPRIPEVHLIARTRDEMQANAEMLAWIEGKIKIEAKTMFIDVDNLEITDEQKAALRPIVARCESDIRNVEWEISRAMSDLTRHLDRWLDILRGWKMVLESLDSTMGSCVETGRSENEKRN